jgi:hypothetical protein
MAIERQSPLAWPADEPRTPANQKVTDSPFKVDAGQTWGQIEDALRKFKATNIVMSLNTPYRGKIEDPAVALFFDLPGGRAIAICCDLYWNQKDNVRALFKIVESMRTIERYGGSNVSQKTFTGFAALPPPKDCWKMLGVAKSVGEVLSQKMRREFIADAFRDRAREGHGAGQDMAALVEARDEALKQLGVA